MHIRSTSWRTNHRMCIHTCKAVIVFVFKMKKNKAIKRSWQTQTQPGRKKQHISQTTSRAKDDFDLDSRSQMERKLVWSVQTLEQGTNTKKNNYRPINIVPIVSKIIEKWIVKIINRTSASHAIWISFTSLNWVCYQCVLRKKTKNFLGKSGCVGAMFIDLKKGIWHSWP